MDVISYKLPVFEGPLDLLLFLVQKNKLNICDIPIAEILDQYMDAIRQMQETDLEVATEFLDMAARLVQIKSAMLLPRHEEETEQLKKELSGELIEYQLCRETAQRLAERYLGGLVFVREPTEIEPDHRYRRRHAALELTDAYLAAAGRGKRRLPPPVQAFQGIVARTVVSVSSRIIRVLRRLRGRDAVAYDEFFSDAGSRSELVATFLALLELVKAKRVAVNGEGEDQTVTPLGGSAADEELVSDFD